MVDPSVVWTAIAVVLALLWWIAERRAQAQARPVPDPSSTVDSESRRTRDAARRIQRAGSAKTDAADEDQFIHETGPEAATVAHTVAVPPPQAASLTAAAAAAAQKRSATSAPQPRQEDKFGSGASANTPEDRDPQQAAAATGTDTGAKAEPAPKDPLVATRDVLAIVATERPSPRPQTVPLKTFAQLMAWRPHSDSVNVAARGLVPRQQQQQHQRSRFLVCHDMMGGYKQDQYPQGDTADNIFRLYHWHMIDIFVYFAHALVTIPPPAWTNCGHVHGAQVLGTFITEWDEGKAICEELLRDDQTTRRAAEALADIAAYYRFDGWLINIENPVHPDHVKRLENFVLWTKEACRARLANSLVIWYDSVVAPAGQLRWQNEVNSSNYPFFKVADGIFLNYTWSPGHLMRTAGIVPRDRHGDVFVGIDVFGRNTYGGGGWKCHDAVKVIHDVHMSVALFAPGWVYENLDAAKFDENQAAFWRQFEPYCTARRISGLPFYTCFSRGAGREAVFLDGAAAKRGPWSHIGSQTPLPDIPLKPAANPYSIDAASLAAFQGWSYDFAGHAALQGGSSLRLHGKLRLSGPAGSTAQTAAAGREHYHEGLLLQPSTSFRLFSLAAEVPPALCVSFSVGWTRSSPVRRLLTPSLVLLLDPPTNTSPTCYIVLPATACSGEVEQRDSVNAKLFDKYGVVRSTTSPLDAKKEHLHAAPISVVTLSSTTTASDGIEWTKYTFLLAEADLRGRVCRELRIRLSLSPQAGDEPTEQSAPAAVQSDAAAELFLGEVALFRPAQLKPPAPALNLSVGWSVEWSRAADDDDSLLLHCSLNWDHQDETTAFWNVFEESTHFYVGRAYSSTFRVHDFPVRKGAKEVVFVVQPVGLAGAALPIALCSKARLRLASWS